MSLPADCVAIGIPEGKESLEEFRVPVEAPTGKDILVRVHAVAMNPVDMKSKAVIRGYDASGVVAAVGPDTELFKVGDEVFYAGSITRPGTNQEYHLVDERIVGRKPTKLSHAEAAAMPLVSITAYEGMFEGMGVPMKADPAGARTTETDAPVVLVVAGAGGVGSTAIQLLKALTNATIVATASRPESQAYCRELGADVVINHHKSLKEELTAAGIAGVDYAMVCVDMDKVYDAVVETLNPCAHICGITNGDGPIDVMKLFMLRGALHWELMFTRPITGRNIARQHALLNTVSELLDTGAIKTTMSNCTPYNVENLNAARTAQQSGRTMGKNVLTLVE